MGPGGVEMVMFPSKLTPQVVYKLLWHSLKSHRLILGAEVRNSLIYCMSNAHEAHGESMLNPGFILSRLVIHGGKEEATGCWFSYLRGHVHGANVWQYHWSFAPKQTSECGCAPSFAIPAFRNHSTMDHGYSFAGEVKPKNMASISSLSGRLAIKSISFGFRNGGGALRCGCYRTANGIE